MRVLHIFQQLHQDAHERRVDQSVRYIRVEDDGFEIDQYIQFVIHSAACAHFVVNLMQVLFELLRLNLCSDLLSRPSFEGQRACRELKVTMPLNVFVADDGLHSSV